MLGGAPQTFGGVPPSVGDPPQTFGDAAAHVATVCETRRAPGSPRPAGREPLKPAFFAHAHQSRQLDCARGVPVAGADFSGARKKRSRRPCQGQEPGLPNRLPGRYRTRYPLSA